MRCQQHALHAEQGRVAQWLLLEHIERRARERARTERRGQGFRVDQLAARASTK